MTTTFIANCLLSSVRKVLNNHVLPETPESKFTSQSIHPLYISYTHSYTPKYHNFSIFQIWKEYLFSSRWYLLCLPRWVWSPEATAPWLRTKWECSQLRRLRLYQVRDCTRVHVEDEFHANQRASCQVKQTKQQKKHDHCMQALVRTVTTIEHAMFVQRTWMWSTGAHVNDSGFFATYFLCMDFRESTGKHLFAGISLTITIALFHGKCHLLHRRQFLRGRSTPFGKFVEGQRNNYFGW